MVICTLSSVEFVVRWKGNIIFFLSDVLSINMQVIKRLKRILGLMCRKGISIIYKFLGILRTKNCLLLIVMNMLMPKLQMVLLERRHGNLCNLQLCCICCSKDDPCWNMRH
jgi:hypothetical protein